MASSNEPNFVAVADLPRIPLIPEAARPLPTRIDVQRILSNRTILLLGDASIRTLYRDLVIMLKENRLLADSEAACQNGEYRLIVGKLTFVFQNCSVGI